MIQLAIEYRQAEKNTPPVSNILSTVFDVTYLFVDFQDFTTNPPTLRFSVFCQKAPKNAQLNGLVQAQDPNASGDFFFDPATKATVKKGAQANTSPFGGAAAAGTNDT